MRKGIFMVFGGLAGLAAWSYADVNSLPVDGYAAVVNSRVITVGDVLSFVRQADSQLKDLYSGDDLSAKREEVYASGLEALIDRALIIEDFNASEATIPDRLVQDRINEIIYARFDNDRARFQQALVEQQVTFEEWREDIRERLVVSIMRRQHVTDKTKISPSEVRRLYDERIATFQSPAQVHVLLIALNRGDQPADQAAKRDLAIELRGKLLAGADFRDLARQYSEGSKASDGGDLGWVESGALRAELAAAAQKLDVGEVSDVIESDQEFYLLKIEDKRAASVASFEDVRGKLEAELRESEGERLYKAWVERLRRKHFVQVFTADPSAP